MPDLSQQTEPGMIWLHLCVFWISKDDYTGTMEGKLRGRQRNVNKSFADRGIRLLSKRYTILT